MLAKTVQFQEKKKNDFEDFNLGVPFNHIFLVLMA